MNLIKSLIGNKKNRAQLYLRFKFGFTKYTLKPVYFNNSIASKLVFNYLRQINQPLSFQTDKQLKDTLKAQINLILPVNQQQYQQWKYFGVDTQDKQIYYMYVKYKQNGSLLTMSKQYDKQKQLALIIKQCQTMPKKTSISLCLYRQQILFSYIMTSMAFLICFIQWIKLATQIIIYNLSFQQLVDLYKVNE